MPMHIICEGLGVFQGSDGRMRSGEWSVSLPRAKGMAGHKLHLHKNKKVSSHKVYEIVDAEPARTAGRINFILGEECTGTRPAPAKWPRRDYVFEEVDPYQAYVDEAKQAQASAKH